MNITGAEGTNDKLTVNTLGGNDVVDASSLPANLIGLTLNGALGVISSSEAGVTTSSSAAMATTSSSAGRVWTSSTGDPATTS